MCDACLQNVERLEISFCAFCETPTADWRVCVVCAENSALTHLWLATEYRAEVAELIKKFKFERAAGAHRPLVRLMDEALPYLDDEWVVVPIPTVPGRVRMRGYDHAKLLARGVAKSRQLKLVSILQRLSDDRQVGAARNKRLQQAREAFYITNKSAIKGAKILLVDDVCTTGATLSAAANHLRSAGAQEIRAVVAAWQPSS